METMAEMIHLKAAREILESHKPCDLKFWKADGEIVDAPNVVCTSSYFKNDTFNIKFLDSNEIRKVQAFLIFEINGKEVYL